MLSRKFFYCLLLVISFPFILHAQIPDRLKQTYWDFVKLNNAGQYQAAILQGKILAQEPKFPYAYGQLAFAFEKAQQLEQGLAYFDSLRQQSPDNLYVYYAIAVLEKSRKKFEPAVSNLKACIKLDPQYAQAYWQLCEVYDALKDLETPANYFRALLREDSSNAAAYYGLGYIFYLKKEWTPATEYFSKSLALNPDLPFAYYLKGVAHANHKDYQKALESWDKGKNIAAKLNDIQLQGMMTGNVGNAYHDMGQWQKAIPYREEALQLAHAIGDRRQEERHLSNLSNSYKSLGQFDKALEGYQKAMAVAKEIDDKRFQETLLGNMSGVYIDKGDYKTGSDYGIQALRMAEARSDSYSVSIHCWNIGAGHAQQADYQPALRYYERALTIKKELGDKRSVGSLLGNMGNVYKEMGDIAEAIDLYTQSLQIAREISYKPLEELALGRLGYAYNGLSEYSKAIGYLDHAIALAEELGDVSSKGTFLGNLGRAYTELGNFAEALEKLNAAIAIHEKIGNLRGAIPHYINIASIYDMRGDYLRGLDYEKKALAMAQEIGAKDYLAKALETIGVFYHKIGDSDEALKYFQQALQIDQDIGLKQGEVDVLAGIGSIYEARGEDAKAEEVFKKSLALARAIGNQESEGNALAHIGALHEQRKKYAEALSYYEQALVIAQKIGQKEQEGARYLDIGNVYLLKDALPTALAFFQKTSEVAKQLEAFDLTYQALGGIAGVHAKQNLYDDALRHYNQALDLIESVRGRLQIESYKSTFLERKISIYEEVIALLHRQGKFEQAFTYLQRFRGRSLVETLAEARADIRRGVDSLLLAREYELQQQLNAKAQYRMQLLGRKHTDEQAAVANKEIEDLLRQYQEAQAQIRSASPSYAALTQPQPLSVQEIQQQVLDEETILLEYALGEERSFLWAVTPTTLNSFALPKRAEIDSVARRVYDLLTARNRSLTSETEEQKERRFVQTDREMAAATAALSQILLGPVAKLLGNKRLLIVSDGALQYIPFGALPVPQLTVISNQLSVNGKTSLKTDHWSLNTDYRPLILDHEIVHLPSASVLAVLRRELASRQPAAKAVAVLADPVFASADPRVKRDKNIAVKPAEKDSTLLATGPVLESALLRSVREMEIGELPRLLFSRREADGIIKHVSAGEGKKAFDFAANRATATSAGLSRYRIVHFATHGLLNSKHPELSGIALSLVDEQGKPQDGFLRLHEIYNLNLPAELVVLSACQTALGKEIKGEGLVGLTRGFMYAGAARVVASLWNVQDKATAELMKRFYEKMLGKEKLRPAAALRAAQIEMGKTKSWRAPYYWAGFVLQGEWR